jgi:hypothetical protein
MKKEWLLTEDLERLGYPFHTANNLSNKARRYGIAEKTFTSYSRNRTHICPRRAISIYDLISYYTRQIEKYKGVNNMVQFIPKWIKYKNILEKEII